MDEHQKRTRLGTGAPPPSQPPSQPPSRGADQPTIMGPSVVPASSGQIPPITATPEATPSPNAVPTVNIGPQQPLAAGTRAGVSLLDAVDPDMFVGQEVCGYLIKRKLAEGGMGVVYEGQHVKIGRRAAIKVLKLEFCRSKDVIERFHQEARAVNAIRHENIVDISEFGRDAYGREFFIMEYLEGEPLSGRIARGAMSWSDAFPILEQTLRALKAAHDKGFVHRDLKPDNIWLRDVDGRVQVKLLDFGIAKLVGSDSPREKLTQTGSVIGTPHYMSPEQINGSKDVDRRTDIYAMGVIMYEMFAGVTPFMGDTLQVIMTGHLFTVPPRLTDIPPNLAVPTYVAEIVDRMLVKDPGARYDNVTEVLSDLHDVHRNRQPSIAEVKARTHPTHVPGLAPAPAERALAEPAPPRRSSITIRILIGAAVLAVAAAGAAVWSTRKSETSKVVTTTPGPDQVVTTTITPSPPPPPGLPPDPELRKASEGTLQASLMHAEPRVRSNGADATGQIRHQASAELLTQRVEQDPDQEVRGHIGDALGMIGAPVAPLLNKLEAAAPPPLKVWYASALARLGDKKAIKRLQGYAASKDLAVSFKAAMTLADVSQPGDRKAIAALQALAKQEEKLQALSPYAGVVIMTKAAALRDPVSRKELYALLEHEHEGVQLAAAEGLAKLGDDAGREILRTVFAKQDSPNRLVAAVAQISLNEYAGIELMVARLKDDKDPEARRLAARGLGDIGERGGLRQLVTSAEKDPDWTVRIAAAAAVVGIIGLDPALLAQASVDWTRGALESQDWAVRKAAAGVLADIPAKDAPPLLARAFADANKEVRLTAALSAGKIKTPEAAKEVIAVVKNETDPAVKEQQVKALGAIGEPVARDVLAEIAADQGRIGVLASGSLVAVGDLGAANRLELSVAPAQPTELRLAAVEAAIVANNPVVVPTFRLGVVDRIFNIRLFAAEGLAGLNVEKQLALPILNEALTLKDPGIVGRAMSALARFGERIQSLALSPAEMVQSPDARTRLAAVPLVRALAVTERVPLLRQLVLDPDLEVRRASVDAIEDIATRDNKIEEAARLYKPLTNDSDAVVRSKASGQLARLQPKRVQTAALTGTPVTTPPDPDAAKREAEQRAQAEAKLAELAKEAEAAAAAAAAAQQEVAAISQQIKDKIAAPPTSENLDAIKKLKAELEKPADVLIASEQKIREVRKEAGDVAGAAPQGNAAKLIETVRQQSDDTRKAKNQGVTDANDTKKQAEDFVDKETPASSMLLDRAKTLIDRGDFRTAKSKLDEAKAQAGRGGDPRIDDLYGQLYLGMARSTQAPAEKIRLLKLAETTYKRIQQTSGSNPARAQEASEQLEDIAEELAQTPP